MIEPDRLRVELGARSYDVLIGRGLLASAGRHLKPLLTRPRVAILTDRTVAELHLPSLTRALGDAELWRRVAAHPTFWLDMPLAPGARDFWEEVRHHHPTFLTGCPRSDYTRAADHKRRWIERHFPGAPVITCLSRDKPAAMTAPGDVLVDDFVANIRRWERAGGVGVLFRGFPQALRAVRRLMGEAETAADSIRNQAHRQDVEFYAFLKKLEEYQRILGDNKSMLLLSSRGEMFDLLFKPPKPNGTLAKPITDGPNRE